MPKFRVHLQQYVEMTATLEVEAADADEARDRALTDAPSAAWDNGDDAGPVQAYAVHNEKEELVWERT